MPLNWISVAGKARVSQPIVAPSYTDAFSGAGQREPIRQTSFRCKSSIGHFVLGVVFALSETPLRVRGPPTYYNVLFVNGR
jgi:hypothetical protein